MMASSSSSSSVMIRLVLFLLVICCFNNRNLQLSTAYVKQWTLTEANNPLLSLNKNKVTLQEQPCAVYNTTIRFPNSLAERILDSEPGEFIASDAFRVPIFNDNHNDEIATTNNDPRFRVKFYPKGETKVQTDDADSPITSFASSGPCLSLQYLPDDETTTTAKDQHYYYDATFNVRWKPSKKSARIIGGGIEFYNEFRWKGGKRFFTNDDEFPFCNFSEEEVPAVLYDILTACDEAVVMMSHPSSSSSSCSSNTIIGNIDDYVMMDDDDDDGNNNGGNARNFNEKKKKKVAVAGLVDLDAEITIHGLGKSNGGGGRRINNNGSSSSRPKQTKLVFDKTNGLNSKEGQWWKSWQEYKDYNDDEGQQLQEQDDDDDEEREEEHWIRTGWNAAKFRDIRTRTTSSSSSSPLILNSIEKIDEEIDSMLMIKQGQSKKQQRKRRQQAELRVGSIVIPLLSPRVRNTILPKSMEESIGTLVSTLFSATVLGGSHLNVPGWLMNSHKSMWEKGVYPGIDYEITGISTIKNNNQRTKEGRREQERQDLFYHQPGADYELKPIYPLGPILNRQKKRPVKINESEIPTLISPLQYNIATAIGALMASGSILVSFFVLSLFVSLFFIPSRSMEPTLNVGDVLLVEKVTPKIPVLNRYKPGDVVMFSPPSALRELVESNGGKLNSRDLFVKRVAAVAGDVVEVDRTGDVRIINGASLMKNGNGINSNVYQWMKEAFPPDTVFLESPSTAPLEELDDDDYNYGNKNRNMCGGEPLGLIRKYVKPGVTVVPQGKVLLLGDCGPVSVDGRVWGTLDTNSIVGRPIGWTWPPSKIFQTIPDLPSNHNNNNKIVSTTTATATNKNQWSD